LEEGNGQRYAMIRDPLGEARTNPGWLDATAKSTVFVVPS
jgi:hypothetical protein